MYYFGGNMNLEEAIKYAVTGNALLFCGSGFSSGAVSINDEKLPIGAGLCKKLKKELGMEEDDDDDIEYYATKYRKIYGDVKLIKLLEENFIVKQVKEYHKVISNVNWKRIYTTNYDNLIENYGEKFKRKAVTLSSEPRFNKSHKELVIHLNGSIHNLSSEKFDSEFKLTMASYSSEEFIKSDWYEIFKNDISSAKAIFFIGFSLKYDLDIRRAIVSRKGIREKSFFIDSISLTPKNEDILSEYGTVLKCGCEGLAEKIKSFSEGFTEPKGYLEPLYVFERLSKDEPTYTNVRDEDVINLLYRGEYSRSLAYYNNENNRYIFKREAVSNALKLLEENKKIIVFESDFGNGKTCVLELLQYELNKIGHVFRLINGDEDINQDIDNILNNYSGKKFIFIDNYHNHFNVLNSIDKYDLSECQIILAERSYINDTLYTDILKLNCVNEENIAILSLNRLKDNEINLIIDLFDNYNLWGENSKWTKQKKKTYIKNDCKRSLKDVLISVFNAPVIRNKLDEILKIAKKDKKAEKIIIMAIIAELVNLELDIDDYLYFLSMIDLSVKIQKDNEINELVDIDNNKIKIKSSILAHLIIQNSKFSDKIVDLLISIMVKLESKRNIQKYVNVQFALISFSNIQLLIREKGEKFNNLIIRYYENIKNTQYCNGNVFFWIQYANARISLKQFVEAKICLDKAKSEMHDNRDYPQYDTCYSRYLLENQLYSNIIENAYDIFEEAHNGIYNNKNSKNRWHFPLKQTNLYYDYFKKFYITFSETEKSLFIMHCKQVLEKIDDYISERKNIDGNAHHRVLEAKKKIAYIIENYMSYDEVASFKCE